MLARTVEILGAGPRRALSLADQVVDLVARGGGLLDRAEVVLDRIEELVGDVAATNAAAARVVDAAAAQVACTGEVVVPHRMEAAGQLLDLTPEMIDLVVPALRGMGELTPEMARLMDRLETIGQVVEGIPGAARLRRRGEQADLSAEST